MPDDCIIEYSFGQYLCPEDNACVTIMCRNDELSWMMSWVGCLPTDSEFFLSYLQKIAKSYQNFCYSHSLNFHVSGSPKFVSKQPTQLIVKLNSSLWHIIVKKHWSKLQTNPRHVQLNQYETVPYFIQFSETLTWDCLSISVFPLNSPEFTWAEPKIVLSIRTEQF